jgi:16S rRNA (uracil1498-N3)-methyltransferase
MTTHVVSPVEFDGGEIEITGQAYQHLFRAKRLRVGDELRVVDGEGRARRGVIGRVDRARGVVALAAAVPTREPAARIELWVAPPKPDRAAWLVEKATEIGAVAIRFVASERAARESFGAHQILRLHRIAIAAVEQCGRSVVPEVSGVHPLDKRLAELEAAPRRAVALDVGAPSGRLADAGEAGDAILLVGPEGGWSDDERHRFAAAGIALAGLGERVLRVETAAIVACALALLSSRTS